MPAPVVVDWTDPCQAAAALSEAYFKLLAGGAAESVHFADRSVTYTRAKIDDLRMEMQRQQALCLAKTTGKRSRFALTAGTRPPGR
jgi:hypothetical protein